MSKSPPRISVINVVDGIHLSKIFVQLLKKMKIELPETTSYLKNYSDKIHEGRNSSTKQRSNTTSNLNSLVRTALVQTPISFCNLITLCRVFKIEKLRISITFVRAEEEFEVKHDITLKEKTPSTDLWD